MNSLLYATANFAEHLLKIIGIYRELAEKCKLSQNIGFDVVLLFAEGLSEYSNQLNCLNLATGMGIYYIVIHPDLLSCHLIG